MLPNDVLPSIGSPFARHQSLRRPAFLLRQPDRARQMPMLRNDHKPFGRSSKVFHARTGVAPLAVQNQSPRIHSVLNQKIAHRQRFVVAADDGRPGKNQPRGWPCPRQFQCAFHTLAQDGAQSSVAQHRSTGHQDDARLAKSGKRHDLATPGPPNPCVRSRSKCAYE